jgi:hypothetical protein
VAYQLQDPYKIVIMPDKKTIERALHDKKEGKSASTQAGEFVHDEIDKTRENAKREAASHQALSKQASSAAQKRTSADRSASAKQASKTKGPRERSEAAKKAARIRAHH